MKKEVHSTPTSSREHANMVRDRFPQRVRSSWFGGPLRWRARTSCHTESGYDRNACANSHPVSTFCAGLASTAPVRWIGLLRKKLVRLGFCIPEIRNRVARQCGIDIASQTRFVIECRHETGLPSYSLLTDTSPYGGRNRLQVAI